MMSTTSGQQRKIRLFEQCQGRKFGRWTVVGLGQNRGSGKNSQARYICQCDCGTTREVCGWDVRNGISTSCGCVQREKISEMAAKNRGPLSPSWKGGRSLTKGYVLLSGYHDHPNARLSDGRILEHVKVMSEILGRPMLDAENVHHKNGVRTDNRPENLELWCTPQMPGQRAKDLLAWAREIISTYEPIEDRI